MAEKIIIDLEAKTDKALKGIKDLSQEVGDLNKEVAKGNKQTEEGLKGVESASKDTAKGVRGIGNALKAAGIGLAIAAFAKLKEIFEQNQVVADGFNKAFEFISIAFNDFANFVVNNASVVTDFFKAIFEDPIGSLKTFGNLVKENIIERFESFLDTLGFIASAVKKVFAGDFAGALDDVKNAGKEYIEIYTGVEGTFDKVADGVTKAVKATAEYVTETGKAAAANVELEKTARLAEAANQGLIEKYDRQAEQLRQTRDDESKSFEERIKANQELGKLLDEQEKTMMANADARVKQTKAELAKNKENIDLQIAYQEALNERAGIEAQITGFRSEQQTNTNSLLREQKDLQNELALIGKSEREIERLELQQDYDAKKLLIEREITDEALKKEALANLETDYNNKIAEIDQVALDEKIANATKERELEKQKIRDKQMVLDAVSQFAGAETGIGKALLIAKQALALKETLLDLKRITFKGTQAVSEAGVSTAQNVAESSKIGFPQNIITIAAAIAQGVSIIGSVKKAVSKTKAGAAAAAGAISAPSVATPSASSQPPAFNLVGAAAGNQLAETIAGQNERPVKAFVTSQDVTTAQSLERNIVEGASI
jgi:hypothetical protein